VHLVGVDNRAAGRLAAATLVSRGYRRLGFLGGPQAATSTEDRLAGFREGAGDALLATAFADAYSFAAGQRAMERLLIEGTRADAWFCGDDILSVGAISALAKIGLRVPEDVGILGMNDMEMAGWPPVNLTTIRQPFDAIVEASVARIAALVDEPDAAPTAEAFPCEIVERGSLRSLPGQD
jgi:DNA-binding LacI/PurR family transcriptional regulator